MSQKFPVWILLERSEDEGLWTSHCLELDVVSQGDTPLQAYGMGVEAAKLAMQWDIEDGHDPRLRAPAPAECYDALHYLIDKGKRMEVDDALKGSFNVIAVRVSFDLDKLRRGEEPCSPPPEPVMRALAKAA